LNKAVWKKEDFMSGREIHYYIGEDNKNFNEDYVSGRLVKRAIRKIHDSNKTDTKGDYSKGYGDANKTALNIIMEETGYDLEEALKEVDTEGENR
jgi:hypothetical protein